MNILKLKFFALFFSLSIVAFGQSIKMGHVDSQSILLLMPEYKAIEVQLKAESDKLEKQLTDMNVDLKQIQTTYETTAATMTEAERAAKEQEFQEKSQKVQAFYQTSQAGLQKLQTELSAPMLKKFELAVQQVGAENDLIYVFESKSGLPLYVSPQSVDVTPLVKRN